MDGIVQSDHHANLAVDNLDAIITSAAIKVGKGEPFAMTCEQWAKTKKLTSVQLLSVLWHALEDDELQKHFDYVSMHTRCATLLNDLRSSYIVGARPVFPLQAKTKRCPSSSTYT